MSETLVPPQFNPEANLPVINPAENLIQNGEVQFLTVSEGVNKEGVKPGGETTIPLDMLDPLQTSESGFNVNGLPADLLSVIVVGRQQIGIIDTQKDKGYGKDYNLDNSRFVLAKIKVTNNGNNKPTYVIDKMPDGTDAAAFLNEPDTAVSLGRDRSIGILESIGIDTTKDKFMSGKQGKFHLADGGALKVVDSKSSNGTAVVVRPTANPDRQVSAQEANELYNTVYRKDSIAQFAGSDVVKNEFVIEQVPVASTNESAQQVPSFEYKAETTLLPEFKIGETTYNFVGRSNRSGDLVFESTDNNGNKKQFYVYTSNSEGSLRVSQGSFVESDGKHKSRLLKGAEDNPNSQYTQDTQLHPEFEQKVRFLMSKDLSNAKYANESSLIFDEARASKAIEQFDKEMNVYMLSDGALHNQLRALTPGRLDKEHIKNVFGLESTNDTQAMSDAIVKNIDTVNAMLEQQGLIPDFSKPVRVEYAKHPVLGDYKKEVFTHMVNGRAVEWVMSSTQDRKVWIERIRFADTKSTSYGTDSELLYSGVLTTKPLDYKQQTTGLPESLVKNSPSESYNDITGFINMFAPVHKYRQQRELFGTR